VDGYKDIIKLKGGVTFEVFMAVRIQAEVCCVVLW
jgi:hypothetical protein